MFRYRAFISYNHSDTRFAAKPHRDLENFRVPDNARRGLALTGGRIGAVFRDVSDLGAASKLSTALTDALCDSEALIVICSPKATTSSWVDEEVREFRRMQGDSARILSIIAPVSGIAAPEETFPDALGTEAPLAADARGNADGYRLALLKVIAGLLDIGLDELVQRDAHRRHVRLLSGMVASAAIAVTMAVLAVLALSSREDAQRRLSQSEYLIGFMLGDLRGQLAPLGQVRVLESVGDKALDYFESLEDTDLTDEALLRKSRALYQIGDVYFELGQFKAAQDSFRLSLEQARNLAAAQPGNNDRLFELAQAEFWVGFAAEELGDLALSERHLLAYKDAALTLHERDTENQDWAMEAFWASNNLGTLEMRRARFGIARAHFEDALRRINELIDQDASPDRLFERSTILSWLGSTHLRRGDLTTARDMFQRALDRPSDPANALFEEERAYELGFLSDVELELGNIQQARSNANQAVVIASTLSAADPDSMDLLFARTAHSLRIARLGMYSGDEVDYRSLQFALQTLLEADNPPSFWHLLALSVADVGVRIADAEAIEWARSLLGSETIIDSSRGGTEREYIDLAVSVAGRDVNEIPRLREALVRAVDQHEASEDYELLLPLLRAFELLGNEVESERKRKSLEKAGSQHPDFLLIADRYQD